MTEPVTLTMYWPIKELLPPCTEVAPEMISAASKILIIDVFLCGGRSQKFYMRRTWSSYGKKKSRTRSKTHLRIASGGLPGLQFSVYHNRMMLALQMGGEEQVCSVLTTLLAA